jgi:hypothetical protein
MIYFARCEDMNGYIKIGRATNPRKRISDLRNGCPYEVILLATLPGGLLREKILHRRFEASRIRGEWFSPSPELMEVIASGLSQGSRQYPYEDRDWLYQKYVEEDMTTTAIADLLGCSHQTIWLWLKKFNIPRRPAYRKSNH